MSLPEADDWCREASALLLANGPLDSVRRAPLSAVLGAMWTLAELDLGPAEHDDLFFVIRPTEGGTLGELQFERGLWLEDVDEPEMLGFSWEIVSREADRHLEELAVIGAPEGGSYGGGGEWLPWKEFRGEVERHIRRLDEQGYRLTGNPIGYDR